MDDQSSCEKLLCEKHGKDSKHYKIKINDVIKTYCQYYKNSNKEHSLKIYKYNFDFSTSIILTDKEAIIGLYRNSKGKYNMPPILVFSSNSDEYNAVADDIHRVIDMSKNVLIN